MPAAQLPGPLHWGWASARAAAPGRWLSRRRRLATPRAELSHHGGSEAGSAGDDEGGGEESETPKSHGTTLLVIADLQAGVAAEESGELVRAVQVRGRCRALLGHGGLEGQAEGLGPG